MNQSCPRCFKFYDDHSSKITFVECCRESCCQDCLEESLFKNENIKCIFCYYELPWHFLRSFDIKMERETYLKFAGVEMKGTYDKLLSRSFYDFHEFSRFLSIELPVFCLKILICMFNGYETQKYPEREREFRVSSDFMEEIAMECRQFMCIIPHFLTVLPEQFELKRFVKSGNFGIFFKSLHRFLIGQRKIVIQREKSSWNYYKVGKFLSHALLGNEKDSDPVDEQKINDMVDRFEIVFSLICNGIASIMRPSLWGSPVLVQKLHDKIFEIFISKNKLSKLIRNFQKRNEYEIILSKYGNLVKSIMKIFLSRQYLKIFPYRGVEASVSIFLDNKNQFYPRSIRSFKSKVEIDYDFDEPNFLCVHCNKNHIYYFTSYLHMKQFCNPCNRYICRRCGEISSEDHFCLDGDVEKIENNLLIPCHKCGKRTKKNGSCENCISNSIIQRSERGILMAYHEKAKNIYENRISYKIPYPESIYILGDDINKNFSPFNMGRNLAKFYELIGKQQDELIKLTRPETFGIDYEDLTKPEFSQFKIFFEYLNLYNILCSSWKSMDLFREANISVITDPQNLMKHAIDMEMFSKSKSFENLHHIFAFILDKCSQKFCFIEHPSIGKVLERIINLIDYDDTCDDDLIDNRVKDFRTEMRNLMILGNMIIENLPSIQNLNIRFISQIFLKTIPHLIRNVGRLEERIMMKEEIDLNEEIKRFNESLCEDFNNLYRIYEDTLWTIMRTSEDADYELIRMLSEKSRKFFLSTKKTIFLQRVFEPLYEILNIIDKKNNIK